MVTLDWAEALAAKTLRTAKAISDFSLFKSPNWSVYGSDDATE